jgi:phosphoglycolate phosphatase
MAAPDGAKQLILYDLDGTLVDTLEDITAAANHMRQALGEPPLTAEAVKPLVGHGLHQLVQRCLGTPDRCAVERGAAIYRAYYTEHLADASRLYPGVREVLEHFKGRRQAVVTNKSNPFSRDLLERLGVASYFFEIVGGEAPYPKKPDPAGVQALMRASGAGPAQTLFIGDSPTDIETARNAGVAVAALLQGFSEPADLLAAAPDILVRDLTELLGHAAQRGW